MGELMDNDSGFLSTTYVIDLGRCTKKGILRHKAAILDIADKYDYASLYLKVDDSQFPNGARGVPKEIQDLMHKNPRIKVILNSQYKMVREFLQYPTKVVEVMADGLSQLGRSTLDMTAVAAFYDQEGDGRRKAAVLWAMNHWMMQRTLPQEFLFVELGFDGEFQFDDDDFPSNVQYFRINGTSANRHLFQKEHLWNIAARISGHDKLMLIDSDMSPISDCDWFKKAYDVLDECVFAQGFKTLRYFNENQNLTGMVKLSKAAQKCLDIEVSSSSQFNPGGVYCIRRSTLNAIGGFNYLPFGGGDALFWHEIDPKSSSRDPWNVLVGREDVCEKMDDISHASGRKLLGFVDAEICHFNHGEMKQRSYGQRHYMLLTQYPWDGNLIMDDENGLAKWVRPRHWFVEVASQLKNVNNQAENAEQLLSKRMVDYGEFIQGVNLLRGSSKPTVQIGLFNLQRRCMKADSMVSPLVSVIVPCYNAEQYIDQCLNSILNNGYMNLEVICVDDRSTDSTVEHIKQMMKVDRRVQLIRVRRSHNIYGGACRNLGMKKATGKYLYFCDSDDYILPGLFKTCVERSEILNAEMCGFQFTAVNADDSTQYYRYNGIDERFLTNPSQQTYNHTTSSSIFNVLFSAPWNRIYRREFIERIGAKFQETRHSNDNLWHISVMAKAMRITHVRQTFYTYRKNTACSVQKVKNNGESLDDTLAAWKKSLEFVDRCKQASLRHQFEDWIYKEMVQVRRHVKYDQKFLVQMRRFVSMNFPSSQKLLILSRDFDKSDVIVSFATYSARFGSDDIYKFIDSLLDQRCECTYRVVANMWDADYKNAPERLKKYLSDNNIEVCTSKFNYKSNNKYLHVMRKYPDTPVITVDDDQVYASNLVQTMYAEHLQNPDMIICGSCRRIKFDDSGKARPYATWKRANETTPSIDIIPIGVGGVLYPLNFTRLITKDTGKLVVKMNLLIRDDLFLHWLSTINGIQVKRVNAPMCKSKLGPLIDHSLACSDGNTALYRTNIGDGGNDQHIHLFDKKQER